jgi:hypothetical protein
MLHSQYKPHLIIAGSAAEASSVTTIARAVPTVAPHSADSRILHLKLAFQQCFTINQIINNFIKLTFNCCLSN